MVIISVFHLQSAINNVAVTVPQGEGEQMVMNLQDVRSTLEDAVAKSHIHLKKDEMAWQLALNPAEFKGIDAESRILVKGFIQARAVRTDRTHRCAL